MESAALLRGKIHINETFHEKWEKIAQGVLAHSLWNDPFAMTLRSPQKDPKKTWKLVKTWSEQMFHGSLAFPQYVGNLVARVNNHAAGRLLAINAAVERGYPDESRSHFLLNIDLLHAMELNDKYILGIAPLPQSKKYIKEHLEYTRTAPLACAIGCLGIGIEALTTHEFSLIGNAFVQTAKQHTALSAGKIYQSQGYFTENIMADSQHTTEFEEIAYLAWKSGELPSDLEECMQELAAGTKHSLDLRQKFFAEIYQNVTEMI